VVGRDRVLAFLRLNFVSQGGVPITESLANVYDIRDGKLRRVEVYTDRDEAREALGLAE
jgi:ketosteroid isomerase-like protein